MQTKDILTISAGDALYPDIFMELKRPPSVIYARGNVQLLNNKHILGIVGSRRATSYGKEITKDLGQKVAANGAVILSGLAYGIDSIAHRAALDVGGRTIAVLPSGLNNVYPVAHTTLAAQILEHDGLLISEYWHDMAPAPYDFVERNRLIAALSKILLVTEAAHKSGTIHTIKYAQRLNVTIAAVPGNINSHMSKGVNRLFFEGAQPILESADLLSLLGLHEKIMKPKYEGQNPVQDTILRLLKFQPLSTNDLVEKSNLQTNIINVQLTMLEIKGVIQLSKGTKWKLT